MSRTYRLDPSTHYTLNGGEFPPATVPTMYGSETSAHFEDSRAVSRSFQGMAAILRPVSDAELDDLLDSLDLL